MARLNNLQKVFIVKAFAQFMTVSEVQAAVKEQFDGLELKTNQLSAYKPDCIAGQTLQAKLKAVYDRERERFLKAWDEIPIANKSFRMKELDRMLHNLKTAPRPNVQQIKELLEQAAKEEGGMFTNRREITGKGGGPLEISNLTPEQKAARVAELVDAARSRKGSR